MNNKNVPIGSENKTETGAGTGTERRGSFKQIESHERRAITQDMTVEEKRRTLTQDMTVEEKRRALIQEITVEEKRRVLTLEMTVEEKRRALIQDMAVEEKSTHTRDVYNI